MKTASNASAKTASRLRYVKNVSVDASDEFVITEQLLREKYNFGWFGENFRHLFFGKTVKKVSARAIAIHQLKEYSTSQQLVDELGEQAITSFAYALSLVEKQCKGGNGSLLANGYANLIIVEMEGIDGKAEVWVVSFAWNSGSYYWAVEADPLDYASERRDGNQVLSRDSDAV